MKSVSILVAGILLVVGLLSFVQPKPGSLKQSIDRGEKVYQTVCLTCHQVDGAGIPRLAPPLIKTKWVTGDKKQLIKIVLKGLPGGTITIEGDTFPNAMPPQEETLTDWQIADVLTYVRNSFGNKAGAVLPAEVKAQRARK
jgi:mono/diheme cytochrome c family protein